MFVCSAPIPLPLPLAQGATLIAALLLILQQLLGDCAATAYQINQVSLRQSVTKDTLLGRVIASAEFFGLGATLAGSLLGGTLGEIIGVRTMVKFQQRYQMRHRNSRSEDLCRGVASAVYEPVGSTPSPLIRFPAG